MVRNANAPAGTGARREGIEDYTNATAPRQPAATDCPCKACADLLAECGEALFPLYRRKLLQRGWAGTKSAAEKRFIAAHRSPARQQAAHEARERARATGALPPPMGLRKGQTPDVDQYTVPTISSFSAAAIANVGADRGAA